MKMNKQRKLAFSSLEKLRLSRKADMPGWEKFLMLILAVFLIVFLIWLAIKMGTGGQEVLDILP